MSRATEGVSVECFFDCSSLWSYLGFHNLRGSMQTLGVPVTWRPILVGGVWKRANPGIYDLRSAPQNRLKQAYFHKDLDDWARRDGLVINFPPACGHPVNAVTCMRLCLVALDSGVLEPFAAAAFEALWRDGRDLAQEVVLEDLCRTVGLDAENALITARQPATKERLRRNGDELVQRGGFGSPTFFVGRDDMYFGNDRLTLVEGAVIRQIGACTDHDS